MMWVSKVLDAYDRWAGGIRIGKKNKSFNCG